MLIGGSGWGTVFLLLFTAAARQGWQSTGQYAY